MNTKRKCQAMLLPTNQELWYNNIVTSPRYPNMIQKFGSFENSYPDECKVHHLYITSDEEIKEGDWFINRQYMIEEDKEEYAIWRCGDITPNSNPKKIIATTDTNLLKDYSEQSLNDFACLPQPSQEFILQYIEEYNKGNVISDVEVEYDKATYDKWLENGASPVFDILKVNPDNTINIKPIKNSWSREEVIEVINKFSYENCDDAYRNNDKWIEENL